MIKANEYENEPSKILSIRKRGIISVGTLVMVLIVFAIAGVVAYFTDSASMKNKFTVEIGNVDITLTETRFDSTQTMANILPGQVIEKNPAIENVGVTPAYVYLKVTVPKEGYTDSSGNTETGIPFFSYSKDNSWTEMTAYRQETDTSVTKVYYYNSILQPRTSTTELFQTVTVANFPNFDSLTNETENIEIYAYAIESNLPEVQPGENAFIVAYDTFVEQSPRPLEIGDRVGYSTSLNGVTLNNWKVFYIDEDYTYLILDGYLPNSAIDTTTMTGLVKTGTYGVNAENNRGELLTAINTKSNWDSLLTGTMNGTEVSETRTEDVWAVGSPDRDLFEDSLEGKYPNATSEYDADDGFAGHVVYNDILYFPYKSEVGSSYGYWTGTAGDSTDDICVVGANSKLLKLAYNDESLALRPIICLPSSVVSRDTRSVEDATIMVDDIVVGNENIELEQGRVAQIRTTGENVRYSSSNTSVATVDENGIITVNSEATAGATTTITLVGKLTGEVRTFIIQTPLPPTIIFNSNGGTGTMADQVIASGETVNLTTNTFTKSGYTFSHWNTKADGSGRSYNDKQQVTDAIFSSGTSLTLYAQWYDSSLTKVKYAVQIYGINQDVGANNQTLGLTFGPATGTNSYQNSYVTHEYEETSEGSGEYYVKIVTHTVAENGTETVNETPEYLTNSNSNRVVRSTAEKEAYDINLHEMSWAEIEAISDKSVFRDCMLCGDTKSVNLTLNSTIRSGTAQTAYGDGAGMLRETVNQYYRMWNPAKSNSNTARNNSAVGTGVTLDSNEQSNGSNARKAGAYKTSHIRATLIGSNVSNPTIGYAGNVNLTSSNCLYSCIESDLQNVITAKKVKYVTGTSTSSYNSNNTPLVDSIWLFSNREMYGTGQYSGKTTEGIGASGVGYNKFGDTESKYYMASYNDSSTNNRKAYNEAGSSYDWWLRSPRLDSSYFMNDVMSIGFTGGGVASCAPYALGIGFCIR
ncbi:MAG: InlB B-repeat-containing protein [Clostridia bacterium]|nr:InlB B-repeat-containing protein [Clostridia bacterium]